MILAEVSIVASGISKFYTTFSPCQPRGTHIFPKKPSARSMLLFIVITTPVVYMRLELNHNFSLALPVAVVFQHKYIYMFAIAGKTAGQNF